MNQKLVLTIFTVLTVSYANKASASSFVLFPPKDLPKKEFSTSNVQVFYSDEIKSSSPIESLQKAIYNTTMFALTYSKARLEDFGFGDIIPKQYIAVNKEGNTQFLINNNKDAFVEVPQYSQIGSINISQFVTLDYLVQNPLIVFVLISSLAENTAYRNEKGIVVFRPSAMIDIDPGINGPHGFNTGPLNSQYSENTNGHKKIIALVGVDKSLESRKTIFQSGYYLLPVQDYMELFGKYFIRSKIANQQSSLPTVINLFDIITQNGGGRAKDFDDNYLTVKDWNKKQLLEYINKNNLGNRSVHDSRFPAFAYLPDEILKVFVARTMVYMAKPSKWTGFIKIARNNGVTFEQTVAADCMRRTMMLNFAYTNSGFKDLLVHTKFSVF